MLSFNCAVQSKLPLSYYSKFFIKKIYNIKNYSLKSFFSISTKWITSSLLKIMLILRNTIDFTLHNSYLTKKNAKITVIKIHTLLVHFLARVMDVGKVL